MPGLSDELVNVATPSESVAVPIWVPLASKSTVPPVGVPSPVVTVVTWAVNVTGWSARAVELELLTVVVV